MKRESMGSAPSSPIPSERGQALIEHLYPGESADRPAAPTRQRTHAEHRALISGGLAATASTIIGLALFWGYQGPLWGSWSPIVVAGIVAAAAGGVSVTSAYLRARRPAPSTWSNRAARFQKIIDVLSILLVHLGILSLALILVSGFLARAFVDLTGDTLTATMIIVAVTSISAYMMSLSGSNVSSSSLTSLLGIFFLTSVLYAMATSTDAHWWQLHFSSLGAGGGASGIIFNGALIIGGLLLTTLGFTIGHELREWKAALPASPRRRPWIVQWSFITLGVSLAGIGLVPTIVSPFIHRIFALGAAVTFGLLLLATRWALLGFLRAFFIFSDALIGLLLLTAGLYFPAHYYSLAAFELFAAGIMFAWITVFVRQLTAIEGASNTLRTWGARS